MLLAFKKIAKYKISLNWKIKELRAFKNFNFSAPSNLKLDKFRA